MSMRLLEGCRLPRTRGDGPVDPVPPAVTVMAAPHARGWTLGLRLLLRVEVGYPARAGMDLDHRDFPLLGLGLPRTRGDGPAPQAFGNVAQGLAPQVRGWTLNSLRC